jgi:hypothetical protein
MWESKKNNKEKRQYSYLSTLLQNHIEAAQKNFYKQ